MAVLNVLDTQPLLSKAFINPFIKHHAYTLYSSKLKRILNRERAISMSLGTFKSSITNHKSSMDLCMRNSSDRINFLSNYM